MAVFAAWRTGDEIVFSTRHGRAPALRWRAGFGSLGKSRRFCPRVGAAIGQASARRAADPAAELRAEMREHYRLKDLEVLTGEECAAAARRVLAAFG